MPRFEISSAWDENRLSMSHTQTSHPRNKINILLLENISEAAAEQLRSAGYSNVSRVGGALSQSELIKAIKGVHLLGIRSKTQLNAKVIDAADKLLACACFGIGVN